MLKFVRFFLCCFFLSFGLFADNAQFGLNTNNFPCGNTTTSINLFKQLNIEWIRAEISWKYIENPLGSFNFSDVDIIATYAQKNNINILFILGAAPLEYRRLNLLYFDYINPIHIDKWTRFVTAMVERYDGDGVDDMPDLTKPIKYWEIWNEPNCVDGSWEDKANQFVDYILIPGIAAIRAADPQAKICGPALCGGDPNPIFPQINMSKEWFNLITQRIGVAYDVLTHHQYYGGDTASGRFTILKDFYNNAVTKGYGGKEFWITETGWPVDNSQGNAAYNMEQMLDYMLANKNWWNKTFWFAYRDSKDIMPLVSQTDEPYPQYYTFRNYTNPPAITVTSPQGGESWARGKTYSIQWNSNNVTNVIIGFLKGANYTPITGSTPIPASNGLYNWTIPSTQAIGTDYKIHISATFPPDNDYIFDNSNANFTIGDVPDKPTLNSPADNASLCTTVPTFSWSAVTATPAVDYYQVQVNYNGTKLYASANINGTSYTMPANILQSGTTYTWYVRAHNAVGWSSWSGRTLNICVFSLPAKPVLNSPADNATVTTTRPTFTWSIVAGCPAVDYCQVQINYNGAKLYASGNLTGTSFTVPANILAKGKTYAWYVRTHNSVGWSGWSGRTIKIQ